MDPDSFGLWYKLIMKKQGKQAPSNEMDDEKMANIVARPEDPIVEFTDQNR